MRIKKMVKRKEFVDALLKYHREYYTDGGFPSIFSLQQKMIRMGICPRCGEHSRSSSCSGGYFPCYECGFKLTMREAEKIHPDSDEISIKTKKRILARRMREKP